MNNIHEKDWAEDMWHGHTGMDCSSEYCFLEEDTGDQSSSISEKVTEKQGEQGSGKKVQRP